jgi:hypothetical protein
VACPWTDLPGDLVECAVLNRDESKKNELARLCADF